VRFAFVLLISALPSCASQTAGRRAVVESVEGDRAVIRTAECELTPGDTVRAFRLYQTRGGGLRDVAVGQGVVTLVSQDFAVVQLAPDAHVHAGDVINEDSPAYYWHPGYRSLCN
jgi:hypothetical protein